MSRWISAIAFVCLGAAGLLAQSKADLSTEETLRHRVLTLQTQLEIAIAERHACEGELGQWRAKVASVELTEQERALKADIERAHPGFTFDPKTGALAQTAPTPR